MVTADPRLRIEMNRCELSLLPVIDLRQGRGGQHKVQGLQEFRANNMMLIISLNHVVSFTHFPLVPRLLEQVLLPASHPCPVMFPGIERASTIIY